MKVKCPSCLRPVPAEQINVASDVAFCPNCENIFALSKLIAAGETEDGELGDPPPGCWLRVGFDDWQLGATTRSYAALFLVPFMCVWSGFSLGGIYGTQIAKGEFDLTMSLFGLPFVAGTLLFGTVALMSVCGKVCLTVVNDQAVSFVGIGPIGWRRRFEWSSITHVVDEPEKRDGDSTRGGSILLESPSGPVRFGLGASLERRAYLTRALRKMLVKPSR